MTTTEPKARMELPFIGGHRVDGTSTFDLMNPADDQLITEIAECGPAEVDAAVEAAREAQVAWLKLPAWQRGEALVRWADLIGEHADELARLDSCSNGKPLRDARNDAMGGRRSVRYWAGMTDKIWGEQLPVTPGHLNYTLREPVGVCGVIMPWNGPSANFAMEAAPALACGNAVVMKPSELTPLSAGRLAELAVEAKMPPGLVNVVHGRGATGQLLCEHPGIGSISFTGSIATGRKIAEVAGRHLKKVALELGGKSPNIVFDDANLDDALNGAVWGVFYYSGQVCIAGTRLLVQRTILDEFVERLTASAAKVRVGDPTDPSVHIGPVASATQYGRVMNYLESGRDQGASVMVGGGRPDGLGSVGRYIAPTVLTDVDAGMRIAQEEIFGPVVAVLPFDDEEEALAIANGTQYGLSAAVWTGDARRLLRMADRLEAGTVFGNTMRVHDPALPLGGFKDSGVGNSHSYGAIETCTQVKRVSLRFDPAAAAPGWQDV
jgi:acyl-CoA reductase-like NAD-dependent aldehyde dehydrogenase